MICCLVEPSIDVHEVPYLSDVASHTCRVDNEITTSVISPVSVCSTHPNNLPHGSMLPSHHPRRPRPPPRPPPRGSTHSTHPKPKNSPAPGTCAHGGLTSCVAATRRRGRSTWVIWRQEGREGRRRPRGGLRTRRSGSGRSRRATRSRWWVRVGPGAVFVCLRRAVGLGGGVGRGLFVATRGWMQKVVGCLRSAMIHLRDGEVCKFDAAVHGVLYAYASGSHMFVLVG